MPWAMAKHCLFLVIALMVICVSSLTIPSDASPSTRAPHSSHASSTHHGNKTTPSNRQDSKPQPNSAISETVTPAPTSAVKAVAASPAKSPPPAQQHRPKIPPILVILSILFGIPLLAFLVVTLALSCCRPQPKKKEEITLNTWDIFRKDRHAALQAAKRSPQTLSPSLPGKSRRSKLSGVGLGLSDVDLGPSARVIRHTPRRPSPLRQVYTAAESVRGAVETPVLADFGSANSLPRSALHYYHCQRSTTRSPGSPASTAASPSPRTPGTEEIIPLDGQAKNLDAVYRPGVIGVKDDRTEVDVSDAYESYFVLGEEEDEDCLIGTACW